MVTRDPAIEAARRALDGDCSLEAAAREVLKPIRAWYEALPESAHVPDLDVLLPLIYTTTELENPDA